MPALRGVGGSMILHFAGIESQQKLINKYKPPHVLFSFASANEACTSYISSPHCKGYLLDSGAFSFLQGKKHVDFDRYVDEYIDFINALKVDHFFEMDIDKIVGLPKVEEFRRRIESRTGKQPIPVFHRERGKEYFMDMCKHYPYVAIGGMTMGAIRNQYNKVLPWFIETAHEYGAKIHGLGFTDFGHVERCRFDTVDSTSWIVGGKFGNIYEIRDGYPKQKTLRKAGHKCNGEAINEYNLKLWLEYSKYLERL